MNLNTKPTGWSKQEIAAASRIAKREGTTAEAIAKKSIRRLVAFSARGALYRAPIV